MTSYREMPPRFDTLIEINQDSSDSTNNAPSTSELDIGSNFDSKILTETKLVQNVHCRDREIQLQKLRNTMILLPSCEQLLLSGPRHLCIDSPHMRLPANR